MIMQFASIWVHFWILMIKLIKVRNYVYSSYLLICFRQAWGPHIDLRDPHFLAFAAAERQFLQSEYEEYAAANSGTVACFRSVVIIVSYIIKTFSKFW